MSNPFINQLKSTQARRQSEYLSEPGRYLLEIKDLVMGKNRKGREFVAVEFYCIDADDKVANPKGCERTYLQMLDADTAARNFRAFLCNALDIPDSSLTDAMIDRAFQRNADTNMSHLAGIKVEASARVIKTRAGNDFTVIDWRSAGEDAVALS